MADTGIYASTAEIQYKAGAGASATSKAEAYTNVFIAQAESYINVCAKKIFATSTGEFGALDSGTRGVLKEAASNLAAIYVINYSYAGWTDRTEVEDMIDILYKRAMDCIRVLSPGFISDP
jgi:hypothetical protein